MTDTLRGVVERMRDAASDGTWFADSTHNALLRTWAATIEAALSAPRFTDAERRALEWACSYLVDSDYSEDAAHRDSILTLRTMLGTPGEAP